MNRRLRPLSRALAAAFVGLHAPLSHAQPTETAATPNAVQRGADLPPVVVRGVRSSLATAQQTKRDRLEIVDAVVADDIVRLPDFSVVDALQRISGVQITRDRGEGGVVVIRGLSQMETLLNGREVFTAGTGRNLDFADIPSEMVSAIHVQKTSSAEQLEGGLGGTVDLRTRRPFDFTGRELAVSARLVHGDLAKHTKPQVSMLASQRWSLAAAGELGVLVNLSHQRRAFREDQKSSGTPMRCDASTADLRRCPELVGGQTVFAPSATSETRSIGERRRTAADVVLQWRPSPAFEWYAEGSYAQLRTIQDSHQINVSAPNASSGSFEAGSVALFPGTSDVSRVTWTDAPVSILSFARDTVDRTRQFAVGGSWQGETLRVKGDLSHTKSFNDLFFSGPIFGGTVAAFTHDLSTRVPGTSVDGTDLLDPANFRYTNLAYRKRPFHGALTAWRLDAEYQAGGGFVESLAAGLRHGRRRASNERGLIFGDTTVTGLSAADLPTLVMPNPYGFMPGEAAPSLRDFMVGNLDLARDPVALRAALGVTVPLPVTGSPLGVWSFDEETQAAYLSAHLKAPAWPLEGKLGLRVVRTRESASGFQSVPGGTGVVPLDVDSRYTDWLPSLSIRYARDDGLVLRAAASKTLTRQNFDQLSPSLMLLRNPVNPALNQGLAGNPELKPVRADNIDLAVEQYFSRTTAIHGTVFWKKVDGFLATESRDEVHEGETYRVSRPRNSLPASIKGIEIGYQQFYDKLPGAWGGLGLQVNYTYVDSRTPAGMEGATMPLQNLSRHSVNLIGMYEHGSVSARIACNWRDRFVNGVTNIVGVGRVPAYTAGYAWLDASLRYRWSDRVSFALEGTNLLRTLRRSHYDVPTRPQSAWLNDRQFSAGLTVRFW